MRTEDFRTREAMYRYMRYAREMMQEQLPFWEMTPADELHNPSGAQVFAKAEDTYAVYLADARQSGTLTVAPGTYRQRWFNPRSGVFEGAETIVTATAQNPELTLGSAPNTQGQDWVILMDSQNTDLTANNPDTDATQDSDAFATTEIESTDGETLNSEAPATTTEESTDNETPVTTTEDTSPETSTNGNTENTDAVSQSVPETGNAQPVPTAELLATFNPDLAGEQPEATSTSKGSTDSGGTTDMWFLLVLLTTMLMIACIRNPALAKNNLS